jgi:hypothetical protein
MRCHMCLKLGLPEGDRLIDQAEKQAWLYLG